MSVTGNSDRVWMSAQTCRGRPTNLRSIFVFRPVLGNLPEPSIGSFSGSSSGGRL